MEYKKFNYKSYNIYTVKTDRFKTCTIEVIFRKPLIKEEYTKDLFISSILTECNKGIKNIKEMNEYCEELYNLNLYSTTDKVGKTLFTSFGIDFLNPKYCESKTLDLQLKLLFDCILNPRINNDEFDKENFEKIKVRAINSINSIEEKQPKYAIIKLLENIDKNSAASISPDGYLKDLDKINTQNLYDYYKTFISECTCDICIIGNLNMEEVAQKISKLFTFRTINNSEFEYIEELKARKQVKKIIEKKDTLQSKLYLAYNLVGLDEQEKNITMHVLNSIFGAGSLDTILGKVVRQENNLCYSVSSSYMKRQALLIVRADIDKKKSAKVTTLVKKCLKMIQDGKFTEDDINSAVLSIKTSLKLSIDSKENIFNNYVFNVYENLPLLEERLNLFDNVTKEDIITVAKKIKLNIIYLLGGDGNE